MVAVLLAVLGALLLTGNERAARNVQTLADGSTLALKEVLLTATNYNYSYKSRGRVANLLAPILPDSILSKLPGSGGGGFGFGPNGAAHL